MKCREEREDLRTVTEGQFRNVAKEFDRINDRKCNRVYENLKSLV